MNQPKRSLKSSPYVISHLVMEQPNLPKTMQHTLGIDQIGNTILQVVLESSDSQTLLSDLASKVGEVFTVDACIIVCPKANSSNINEIGCWQEKNFTAIGNSQIIQQVSRLQLSNQDAPQSSIVNSVNRKTSHLFGPIEHLLQEILANQTWLGITTQYQHQTNGLVLLFKSHPSGWTDSEQEVLEKISESMAIAISQVQLQQQARTKTRYQVLLNNLSREISQSSDPQLLFHNCLAEISTTLQVDRGMILMLKYQHPLTAKSRRQQFVEGTVQIASQWSSQTDSSKSQGQSQGQLSFSINDSDLCQQAWQTAPQYLNFDSGVSFPDLNSKQVSDDIPESGSALLMMPLMGKQNTNSQPAVVLGFLVLQDNSTRYWLEDELDLVDWVGLQISTAIIHHQTLNQVQSIVEERTAQLQWSLDVQAKLSEKMRQHIEQLEKLNQLKDDFMNSMSHELKTPLTSMKMAIKMLRQAQISPDMREKYLNILEQEWNREYNLIKDLLTLQQVESGELTYSPQELDLNQAINNLAQSFTAKWQPEKGINLKTSISHSNLKIDTDAESLEHILNELLLNAGKYSDANTVIELSVESQTTDKGKDIVISIANNGAGIAPEELHYIFDKFRRGQGVTDRAVPGTGLGLTLVKYLVDHLNGTIEVTSEPVEDDSLVFMTTFVIRLPQFQPSIG